MTVPADLPGDVPDGDVGDDMIFGREPAAIAAVVAIGINLFVSFGLKLSIEQIAGINALTVAVLGLIVRQVVTPVGSPVLEAGTAVKIQGTNQKTTI